MELFTTGRVIDVALVAIFFEAVVLGGYWARTRKGLPPLDLVGQLLAGACLLLALRFATNREVNPTGMLFLSAAFPAHLLDLGRRLYTYHRLQRAAERAGG